ncbi:hypothetical protein QEN19_002969 [Hanseniaspora menglaensis]
MHQLKTYLTFTDNVTQIWINQYSIAILIIGIKLFSFTKNIIRDLDKIANNYTGNQTCLYIDYIIYEAPKELSVVANYMIKKSLQESLRISFYFFADFLLVVFNILFFMLELWFGTYACLFLTAADTVVDVAVNATEAVVSVANKTVHTAFKDLNKGLNDLTVIVDDVITIVDKVEDKIKKIFKANDLNKATTEVSNNIKKVNLTINSLNNFYINGNINSKLNKLANDTPTFEELKKKSKAWLETPFYAVADELKNQDFALLVTPNNSSNTLQPLQVNINSTLNGTNSSLVAKSNSWCKTTLIPDIKALFKHCEYFLNKFVWIIVIVCIAAFILSLIPEFYKEFLFWKKMSKINILLNSRITSQFPYVSRLVEESDSKNSFIKKDIETTDIYMITFQDWKLQLLSKLPFFKNLLAHTSQDPRSKSLSNIKWNWIIRYMFSTRSSILFLVAASGALVCLVQFLLITKIQNLLNQNKSNPLSALNINQNFELQEKMILLLNGIKQSFGEWQNNTNEYIGNVQVKGNNEVIVKKIDYIAGEINSTATKIYTAINSTISDAFSGTVFEKPLQGVMNCIIGNKLASIAKGAAWVKDEFQISLPRISTSDTVGIFGSLKNELNDTTYNISALTSNETSVNISSDSFHQIALQSIIKVNSEIQTVKNEIEKDLQNLLKYYRQIVKTEVTIVGFLFALWAMQGVFATVLLKFHYNVL